MTYVLVFIFKPADLFMFETLRVKVKLCYLYDSRIVTGCYFVPVDAEVIELIVRIVGKYGLRFEKDFFQNYRRFSDIEHYE